MEKTGSVNFSTSFEKRAFAKLAMDHVDPMLASLSQAYTDSGASLPMDPSLMSVGMPQEQGQTPEMMAQMQAEMQAQGQQGQAVPQEAAQEAPVAANPAGLGVTHPDATMNAVVGESISNKDIESLVKIINIITSLKAQYDVVKKDQLAQLKDQMSGVTGAGAGAGAEQAGLPA